MKTTLNSIELKELNACSSGYIIFKKAHGCSTVNLSQALESNGWDDIWWFISSAYGKFTIEQKKQIDLLGCGWAMNCLSNFEDKYPSDIGCIEIAPEKSYREKVHNKGKD